MHIFHKWHMWSEPTERIYQTYDAPPALVPNQELKTYTSMVQTRTCATCGKFQWRKV